VTFEEDPEAAAPGTAAKTLNNLVTCPKLKKPPAPAERGGLTTNHRPQPDAAGSPRIPAAGYDSARTIKTTATIAATTTTTQIRTRKASASFWRGLNATGAPAPG
jgi:hypothetical protein